MFNFLFVPGFLLHNLITFGLTNYIQPENARSLSILTNSVLVSGGSYLFLQNQIPYSILANCFQLTLGFYANEILFNKIYNIEKGSNLKILHHMIGTIAIWRFPYTGIVVPTLFFSEVSNIPLEIRNISKREKFNRYYIQEIMITLLYVSYFYYRIYKSPFQAYDWYQENMLNNFELGTYIAIFSLWTYWFWKINFVIKKKISNNTNFFLRDKFSNLLKNF